MPPSPRARTAESGTLLSPIDPVNAVWTGLRRPIELATAMSIVKPGPRNQPVAVAQSVFLRRFPETNKSIAYRPPRRVVLSQRAALPMHPPRPLVPSSWSKATISPVGAALLAADQGSPAVCRGRLCYRRKFDPRCHEDDPHAGLRDTEVSGVQSPPMHVIFRSIFSGMLMLAQPFVVLVPSLSGLRREGGTLELARNVVQVGSKGDSHQPWHVLE